jgi:hypothetical protein
MHGMHKSPKYLLNYLQNRSFQSCTRNRIPKPHRFPWISSCIFRVEVDGGPTSNMDVILYIQRRSTAARSSFSAVTGPAFSRPWNWRRTFCRCTFTHSNVCEIPIHANRQERFFPTSARRTENRSRRSDFYNNFTFIRRPPSYLHTCTSKWHKKILKKNKQ